MKQAQANPGQDPVARLTKEQRQRVVADWVKDAIANQAHLAMFPRDDAHEMQAVTEEIHLELFEKTCTICQLPGHINSHCWYSKSLSPQANLLSFADS